MIFTLTATILIEGMAVLLYSRWRNKPLLPLLLTSVLANIVTQSLLWIGLSLFHRHYWLTLTILEVNIWLIESFFFYRICANQLDFREAIFVSLLINFASFGMGLALPV